MNENKKEKENKKQRERENGRYREREKRDFFGYSPILMLSLIPIEHTLN